MDKSSHNSEVIIRKQISYTDIRYLHFIQNIFNKIKHETNNAIYSAGAGSSAGAASPSDAGAASPSAAGAASPSSFF